VSNGSLRVVLGALGSMLALASCLDRQPISPQSTGTTGLATSPTVSDPRSPPTPLASAPRLSTGVIAGTNVVYVSLPPGTEPDGGLAIVRDTKGGASIPVPMGSGGFDPIPILAGAGDTIVIEVERVGGAIVPYMVRVPAAARPVVVRTNPPPRKRDVPLNAAIVVVFSEPILAGTESNVTLLKRGVAVGGAATLSADGLRATFQPSLLLDANADYVISVSTGVTDQTGDVLGQPVTADFTAGTTSVTGSVATDPAALITDPNNGELRSFTMSASRQPDGEFSGSFTIFYPGPGWRAFGRVACFTIQGGAAWIAGVIEAANDTTVIGHQYGWRAVDNGPDALSLAFSLDGWGTAEDFCSNRPTSVPGQGQIILLPLIGGNVIVGGTAGPPPAPAMSQIAFAAWPSGGIQVITADGSAGRILTGDSADYFPAWSPDGATLAFERNRAKLAGDIYLISSDGSGLRPLTNDVSDDGDPAWSPDGRLIAFHRNGQIYVMNAADGSGGRPLSSTHCDYEPAWSPNGSRIAFASCRNGMWQILVMNADGSGETNITANLPARAPSWSPDGSRIAFQGWNGKADAIFVVNPDGSGLTQVAPYGLTPAWSWDSRSIVFELYGLKVMNADGTGIHPLGNGYDPAWSPQGALPPPLPLAGSVRLPAARDTLRVGGAVTLTAIVRDDFGNVMPSRLVAWVINGQSVAFDVWPPGYMAAQRVTALTPGVASVTVTVDGKSDTMVIVVIP
jgi:hypothetical protein